MWRWVEEQGGGEVCGDGWRNRGVERCVEMGGGIGGWRGVWRRWRNREVERCVEMGGGIGGWSLPQICIHKQMCQGKKKAEFPPIFRR